MRSQNGFGLLFAHMGVALFAIVGVAVLPQSLAAQSGGSGITTEPVSLPDTAPDQSRLAPEPAPPSYAIMYGTLIGAGLGIATGLIGWELMPLQCGSDSTFCSGPTRTELVTGFALGGAAVGALIGALVKSRRSSHGRSSQWSILPSGEGGMMLRLQFPAGPRRPW